MLLNRQEAGKKIGRHWTVIRDWQLAGVLPVARFEDRQAMYEPRHVLAAAKEMRRRYRQRTYSPGSGRGNKHHATDEIRRRILAGEKTKDIAAATGCSPSTVSSNRRILTAENVTGPPSKHSEGVDASEQ